MCEFVVLDDDHGRLNVTRSSDQTREQFHRFGVMQRFQFCKENERNQRRADGRALTVIADAGETIEEEKPTMINPLRFVV